MTISKVRGPVTKRLLDEILKMKKRPTWMKGVPEVTSTRAWSPTEPATLARIKGHDVAILTLERYAEISVNQRLNPLKKKAEKERKVTLRLPLEELEALMAYRESLLDHRPRIEDYKPKYLSIQSMIRWGLQTVTKIPLAHSSVDRWLFLERAKHFDEVEAALTDAEALTNYLRSV